jgi:PPOX class probable F420-dependent enzyme
MPIKKGNVALLNDPVAQELLRSQIPARLAYVATDGTPRAVPIWFTWNGRELVMASPSTGAKLSALAKNPNVALTIDSNEFPYKVLLIRGKAEVSMEDAVPEYDQSARRYLGEEAGSGFAQMYAGMVSRMPVKKMARIVVRPTWVAINDFQTRFPTQIQPYLPAG